MITALGRSAVAKTQRPDNEPPSRNRVDIRADPSWVARVERQAERLGITITAYIKAATSRALEADEATDPSLSDDR